MTSVEELHQAVLDRLVAVSALTVFKGDVTRAARVPAVLPGQTWSLPADNAGRVYPYVLVWPGAGDPTPELDVAAAPTGELAWEVRVTVASGDVDWTLRAAAVVRTRLHLVEVLPGVRLRHEPLGVPVSKDTDPDPVRWFVPLAFRCLTP